MFGINSHFRVTYPTPLTHHFGSQVPMHVLEEDCPPELQKLSYVLRAGRAVDVARARVETLQPWFHCANKVQDLDVLAEPTKRDHSRR